MEILLAALFIFIFGASAIAILQISTKNRAPMGARVEPGDSSSLARQKTQTYHLLMESVRIFHKVLTKDQMVPILDNETRDEIETLLAEFYKQN